MFTYKTGRAGIAIEKIDPPKEECSNLLLSRRMVTGRKLFKNKSVRQFLEPSFKYLDFLSLTCMHALTSETKYCNLSSKRNLRRLQKQMHDCSICVKVP